MLRYLFIALGLVLNNADVDARAAAIVVTHTLISYGLPMVMGPLAGAWVVDALVDVGEVVGDRRLPGSR